MDKHRGWGVRELGAGMRGRGLQPGTPHCLPLWPAAAVGAGSVEKLGNHSHKGVSTSALMTFWAVSRVVSLPNSYVEVLTLGM